ncbi:hypothetical protein B0H13DRAFT_283349 [Mycena leptocephala]|nr:hypothetical protein B0H13DRAFT_283349 [Mycena leptocephala]
MTLFRLLRGRTPGSQHILSRTITQIYVICALGMSWIGIVCTQIAINTNVCRRDSAVACVLFVISNISSWSLFLTLFGAAYAMYRRAVALHGNTMVPVPSPPLVPAWSLSHISDSARDTKNQYSG